MRQTPTAQTLGSHPAARSERRAAQFLDSGSDKILSRCYQTTCIDSLTAAAE